MAIMEMEITVNISVSRNKVNFNQLKLIDKFTAIFISVRIRRSKAIS